MVRAFGAHCQNPTSISPLECATICGFPSKVERTEGQLCGAQRMPFDLSERFISAAEEKLGAPLPHSYRQAMMASNGGEVTAYDDVWNLYPILDTSDSNVYRAPATIFCVRPA